MGLLDKLFTKRKPADPRMASEDIPEEISAKEEPAESISPAETESTEPAQVTDNEISAETAEAERDTDKAVEGDSSFEPDVVKENLLIATWDGTVSKTLEDVLSAEYALFFAATVKDALKLLREHSDIDVALLDVSMDDEKGLSAVKIISGDPKLSRTAVVALTSNADMQKKALDSGAIDFIPMPLPDAMQIRLRVDRCAELCENREIISRTERDDHTALYNADYFRYYAELFDRRSPETRMDAVVLMITNLRILSKNYGRRFAETVGQRVGKAVKDITGDKEGFGCRANEDTFYIYRHYTEDFDYDKFLSSIVSTLRKDSPTGSKERLCLGVYRDIDKSISVDRRFERAVMAASSVVDSLTDKVGIYNEEMKEKMLYREQILGEFVSSLKNDRFKIYFQPKFDIRGERPVLYSAEALVRWDHPQLGLIGPGAFIDILEENGLITQLDRYVWSSAAAEVRRWKDEFGYSVPVSVNISRVDMLLPLLKDIFKDILKSYSLTENDIILEITEGAYDNDDDQMMNTAQELRGMGMGMRIEMGNFSANYSSIGMLSSMPVDVLKINMDFIHKSLGGNKDMRMIELIIDIADYLNVPVLAEGVETEEQYIMLKALGCDIVQGYYFSKPVPKEEFDHFVTESKDANKRVTVETKRSYVSISKALSGEYEKIFYIDVKTNHYLQFYSGAGGEFRIQTGGRNFFADAEDVILSNVADEDVERIAKLISREQLMEWIDTNEPLLTHFKDKQDGRLCALETVHTRNQDEQHIVIGISRKDEIQ